MYETINPPGSVNPQGTLLNAEVYFYNLGRNVEELLRKFKANIHLAGNPLKYALHCGCRRGDKTLKPSATITGRFTRH